TATEGVGNASIQIDRVGGSTGAVSVQFDTVAGGTATAGSQYTTTSQVVNFGAGVTTQSVNVPILDNSIAEGANRTVHLALRSPPGGPPPGPAAAALSRAASALRPHGA